MSKLARIATILAGAAGAAAFAGCADNVDTGTSTEEILTTYSGLDPGAGPAAPRPNSSGARAAFEAALGGADLTLINFESAPVGAFATLTPAPGVTVTLADSNGGAAGTSGIAGANAPGLFEGFNTTPGGARHLKITPDFGVGTITATFDYDEAIRGFGAYFTGVGTVDGAEVEMLFDDGSQQLFAIPGASNGGVGFFGFTDPGRGITRVQIRERLLGNNERDIFSIDDVLTARDNVAPVAVCHDVTIDANTACVGAASIDAGSSDPDGDAFTCTQSPASPYDLGSTLVTLTCTDAHGASSSCDATVTVADTTAPDLHCPADQTVECNDGQGGAVATFTAEAHDSCDADPTVACAPPSGSTFPLGDTAATCSATDDAGNRAECTHTVTVADTVAPVVTGDGTAGNLWPPNHSYRRVDLSACIDQVQDACDGSLSVANARITCCTSDEPDDGLGDGHTGGDCVIVDHDSVDVRAERQGGGNGRVYTIRYDVTDGAGNVSSETCTVGVPHSPRQAPVDDGAAACGDDGDDDYGDHDDVRT